MRPDRTETGLRHVPCFCFGRYMDTAFGYQELPDLRRFFATHDFNIRKLMVEVMATSALTPASECGPGH